MARAVADKPTLAEQLLTRIRTGRYPPGTWLRQEALADEFAVSRTPIREALRQLEAQGIVHLVPNQGALVRSPDAREIREAYQVRAELEGLAAHLAVAWITDEQIDRLRRAQRAFITAVEAATPGSEKAAGPSHARRTSNWVEANDEFHAVIIEASGNQRLALVLAQLHIGFLRSIMLATVAIDGRFMRENIAQHDAILSAVERHDAAEARRTMAHHVQRSGEQMVRWLETAAKDAQ